METSKKGSKKKQVSQYERHMRYLRPTDYYPQNTQKDLSMNQSEMRSPLNEQMSFTQESKL